MRISDWSSDVCSSDLLAAHCECESAYRRWDRSCSCFFSYQLALVMPGISPFIAISRSLWRVSPNLRKTPRGRPVTTQRLRRSEEHTSELQSLMRISYAVFCLKKKNNNTTNNKQL